MYIARRGGKSQVRCKDDSDHGLDAAAIIDLRTLKGTGGGIISPMRPKGSAEALEVRRRIAAHLLQQGKGLREVARLVDAAPSSVFRWQQALQQRGMEALQARAHPGRPPRLTPQQKQSLADILRQGAPAAGFPTDLWTLARVAQVIERSFGVAYHPGHVWRILREMGWSPQKPE